MRGKTLMALLILGLLVASLGCIGGGGGTTSSSTTTTPTQTSSTTETSGTTTSPPSTTTSASATTTTSHPVTTTTTTTAPPQTSSTSPVTQTTTTTESTTTSTTTTPSETPTTTTTTTSVTTTTASTTTTPSEPTVKVSELPGASGQVYLEARWVRLYYDPSNRVYLMEVRDDSGTANLTADRSILPNPAEVGTGSLIRFLVDAGELRVLNLSVVEVEASPVLHASEVTFDRMGTTAIVEGNVASFQTLGSNLKFLLVDSTGNVTIFVPGSVAQDLPEEVREGLEDGVRVRIAGYITEYKGTIEIIPYRPEGVELVS